ncbi:hypothetical protein [Candidatus Binatus sp.]|uniref:hypothetical protein n=1 Tax=Candidatus Binatus sp. TaxID=2811406 RepID=UPI003CC53FF6
MTQTEISLRAIRLHLVNYQLQLLRLSVLNTAPAQKLHRDVPTIRQKPSIFF